ncbi:MAG: GNAT family N-acetyltransferase [Oscillibacter sp.]|nr:GNAT family N-acetyltransferase [Oscillibacter sp.]
MTRYPIRKITGEEVDAALSLALEVFMEFEAPDYGPEGVESFKRDIVENGVFISQCREGVCPIYAAFDGDRIIGIMGMRSNKTHINLVFTKKEYHHQGIATALFEYLKQDLLREDPNLKEITLNSSPYGKGFYLHIGFVPQSEEQEKHGIRFTPMKYLIN